MTVDAYSRRERSDSATRWGVQGCRGSQTLERSMEFFWVPMRSIVDGLELELDACI